MNTNLKKKALLPLVAMVLVSVIAFSGVTYAWFTTSNTASVETLDVQVQAANGIQISLDAKNWTSLIDADAITSVSTSDYAGVNNRIPTSFISPVSTNGVVAAGKLSMFKGELKDTNNIVVTAEDESTTNNYIVFDIFFKMTSDKIVNLDAASDITGGADSAARVAFINLGNNVDPAAAQQLKGNGSVTIWDTAAEPVEYYGLKKATPVNDEVGIPTENGLVPASNTEYVDKVQGVSENQISLDLKQGINKVRIYIWLEGQDAQCINDIATKHITTLLKFVQEADNA